MTDTQRKPAAADWLLSGGQMGQAIGSIDWSKTPLGPIESWPQSLRTTVSLCLASNFPISIAWGPKHTQIYNDGYWPICGGKHPTSLGQDFTECWASAWPVVGEAFERALAGETRYLENQRMFLDRNGYLEETFFTFSFSPVRDETGGVGGLFHPVTETTSKMLNERRTRVLRDLAARSGKAQTSEQAFDLAAQTLATCDLDVPFALLYSVDAAGNEATLVKSVGLSAGGIVAPAVLAIDADGPWPIAEVVRGALALQVDDLEQRFGPLSCGPYPESPQKALLLPIMPPGCQRPAGILIAGVSSRLQINELYRGFFDQLAAALTAAVANARAHEEQHKRAEMLAELDRAKTAFFSNVSHEFRTPLTLMLGPLEEARNEPDLRPEQRDRLDIAHRNSLRLLKLVNTLLEFSRIEAGRVEAAFEPTDLSVQTADLASAFRSAIEKAGLEFVVDCPPLPEQVYIDRDMWEKIVLNLLSNAFKFTFKGSIAVRQKIVGDRVELAIEDTGTGIPADQLGRVFKRFHRVEGAHGRTHEGTGIGLALVEELTRFHGGAVRVQSALGTGTTFTVSIPLGKSHLPADRIGAARAPGSTSVRVNAFAEEAKRWIARKNDVEPADVVESARAAGDAPRPRVLLADDNADMRDYVRRILAGRYDVTAVADGEAAIRSVRESAPDLVLSDVMMPALDGFGLLQQLRADPKTASIPVILLSARAGEESRVEGLEAGADDYLVKPFSSRELLARVGVKLELARMRREIAQREQEAAATSRLLEAERQANRAKDQFLAVLSHELRTPLTPVLLIASMLERDKDTPDYLREDLRTIREHVEIEVRLINDLLDMTKIVRGKLHMDWGEADLHELLETIADEFAARAPDLQLELHATQRLVRCDSARLRQVFCNLIDNALKFTDGLGSIVVRSSDDGIDRIRVEVQDTGMGIDASVLPKLFNAFEQGEIRTVRQQAGLGLGLAIARNLVEAHGGKITAASEGRGRGATFTVGLPATLAIARGSASENQIAFPGASGVRVLVVEDHQPTRQMLLRLLKSMGHTATGTESFTTAIAAANMKQFDLLVSDLGLADGNGLNLMRHLRDRFEHRSIALTGYGTAHDIRQSREAGFAAHLTKPIDITTLQATISKVLAVKPAA